MLDSLSRRLRGLLAALTLTALLALVPGCSPSLDPWKGETAPVRVVVTIAPLASLVYGVAGDRAAVRCICTSNGPHHFEPGPHDHILFRKADLFLAVGLTLDDSFADALHLTARRSDLRFVKLGGRVLPSSLIPGGVVHVNPDGSKHSHGKYDPHLWLGVPEMITMLGAVRDELIAVDKDGADTYRKNAEALEAKLRELRDDGLKMLEGKKNRRLISFHESLGYFARTFKLEVADVMQERPGDEPTPKRLAAQVDQWSKKGQAIGAVTVEPQYRGSNSASVLQKELARRGVTVPVVTIDTLETADPAELQKERADWYLSRMRKNLKALADHLP